MFTDTTLNLGAVAMLNGITHLQLHSANPGSAGTTGAVGSRVASTGTVSGKVITWPPTAYTGLAANQAVTFVSYWPSASGGTCRGYAAILSGDTAANASGEYTLTGATETASATS